MSMARKNSSQHRTETGAFGKGRMCFVCLQPRECQYHRGVRDKGLYIISNNLANLR